MPELTPEAEALLEAVVLNRNLMPSCVCGRLAAYRASLEPKPKPKQRFEPDGLPNVIAIREGNWRTWTTEECAILMNRVDRYERALREIANHPHKDVISVSEEMANIAHGALKGAPWP